MSERYVTVIHQSGKREIGTIKHDRSGSGPMVCTGNYCRSVPRRDTKGSSIKVVYDGGRSVFGKGNT